MTRFLDEHLLTRYLVSVRIAEPARKHAIADEDTMHAVRNAISQWRLDEQFTMRVGPARHGDLLEVGVLGIDSDDRPQYLPHR